MAKNIKKLPDFFSGYRKECRLVNYQALVSKGDEKRIKLSVEILLSNQNNKFMPERFVPIFGLMEKEESTTNLAKEAVMCEDMTVDLFATEDSKQCTKSITSCTLQDFKLVGNGEKDKRKVCLQLIIYMPADSSLNQWAFSHLHKTFYLETVPAQSELFDKTSTSTAIAVVPPPKSNGTLAAKPEVADKAVKSGPKDLKEFHAAQTKPAIPKSKKDELAVQ